MKKILMFTAFATALYALPVLAQDGDASEKPRHERPDGPHGEKGKRGDVGQRMFDMHDTNKDGVVSKAEFLEHATKRFAEMDLNGDGEITKEEAKKAHEKMREKFKEKRKEKHGERGAPADAE